MLIRKSNSNNSNIKKRFYRITIFSVATLLLPFLSFGQCAMCRAALESEGNTSRVEAVNDGIVFLMAIPYLLVAAIGYVIYRMYYKKKEKN